MQLTPHFTLAELCRSTTAQAHGIDNLPGEIETGRLRALCTAVLEPLRAAIGGPLKINSGYRGPALNRRIGGATKSQHLAGEAADLQAPGLQVVELFQRLIGLKLPYDQLIYEVNGSARWVHVSHRAGANRGQILIADFGPDGRVLRYRAVSAAQALDLSEPRRRAGIPPGADEYLEIVDEPARVTGHPPARAAAPRRRPAATRAVRPG